MKKLTLLLFILILLPCSNAIAYEDICQAAQLCLKQTSIERDKYFDSYLRNRRVEGSGIVRNVSERHKSTEYSVIVDCGNDVILELISQSAGLRYLDRKSVV